MSTLDTKRVTIGAELYNTLYAKSALHKKREFAKKGDQVAWYIDKLHTDYLELLDKDCIELKEDAKKKISMLLKLGINDTVDNVIEEAIALYIENKKEAMRAVVDSI
ncbi:hypothetical protein JHD48_10005 [Sulfurimonas sp. SAG-AH-194-I05]|nr:hypothetical protein [Sulfurimonas sp. SAG-AH-194-I05]MDF1876068.1 hypothetical protein [Sulfurimonas sp. SAG-AH-194-I05]